MSKDRIPYIEENTIDVAAAVNDSLRVVDGVVTDRVEAIVDELPQGAKQSDKYAVNAGDKAGLIAKFVESDAGGFWEYFDSVLCALNGVVYVSDGKTWQEVKSNGGLPDNVLTTDDLHALVDNTEDKAVTPKAVKDAIDNISAPSLPENVLTQDDLHQQVDTTSNKAVTPNAVKQAIDAIDIPSMPDDYLTQDDVQQELSESYKPVSANAVKIAIDNIDIGNANLSEYRKLDNIDFDSIIKINAKDNVGAGVFLLCPDDKVRGQMVYNNYGLQFAQVQEDGTAQTFTFPRYGDGGEILTDKVITNEIGDSTELVASQALVNSVSKKSIAFSSRLIKEDIFSPCFIKTSPSAVAIKAGSAVVLKSGEVVSYYKDTEVNLISEHVMGSDYAIYADKDGLHAIVDNFEDPAEIPEDAVLIGGYHYSLIPENETLKSGEFATSGAGMIWTQADVDRIRGINEFSLWDIRFRAGGIIASPLSPRFGQLSNHSMAFDRATNRWYAMFHVSSDVDKFGISRAGTDIASGDVHAIIPSAYGGNGSKKYDNLNWWTANELANSQGSRLLWEYEFNSRAFGVTENKTAGGAGVTYPKTERIKGLTSKIGCEQTVGTHYYWGLDTSFRNDGTDWGWKDVTKGRGQLYTQGEHGNVKAIFGGYRSAGVGNVGSRMVAWANSPWSSYWDNGVVATRDLLIL